MEKTPRVRGFFLSEGLARAGTVGASVRRPAECVEDGDRVEIVAPVNHLAVAEGENRDEPIGVRTPAADRVTFGGVFEDHDALGPVVVDREMRTLLDMVTSALTGGHPRELLEQAAFALLDYVENYSDGFRILVRDSPVAASTGNFASLISDIATQVEGIMATEFRRRAYDPEFGAMYSQMLVGMVALTGQWWLDAQHPSKDVVAAHMVNLAWNGLSGLEHSPRLMTRRGNGSGPRVPRGSAAAQAAARTAAQSQQADAES